MKLFEDIRFGFVILLVLALTGCHRAAISHTEITGDQLQIAETTNSVDSHVVAAQAGTTKATAIAKGSPAAAPVLPPLATVATELNAAHDDVQALKKQEAALTVGIASLETANDTLATENQKLKSDNAAWKEKWDSSWFGGKFWLWFKIIVGAVTLIAVGLFAAEFFFGAYVHPFTWIAMLIPKLFRGCVNVVKGIVAAIKTLFAGMMSAGKATAAAVKAPAALQPSTPPSAAAPSPAPPSG